MGRYLKTIRFPIILTVVNGFAGFYLCNYLPGISGHIVFNIVRLGVVAYAGWLLVAVGGYSIRKAACAGFLLLFLDHVIITGGAFLCEGQWRAFAGVASSFFMFVWIEMAVAGIGGYIARKRVNAI